MSTTHIKVVVPQPVKNKVTVIKSIRSLTGIGLKEAKDASEQYGEQTFTIKSGLDEFLIEDELKILRNEGVILSDPIYGILDELRRLGSEALLQGEDELANEILQLVLIEKLRRKQETI